MEAKIETQKSTTEWRQIAQKISICQKNALEDIIKVEKWSAEMAFFTTLFDEPFNN
jgi:hypothetical protein